MDQLLWRCFVLFQSLNNYSMFSLYSWRDDDHTRNYRCSWDAPADSLCYNWISGNDPLSSHHHCLRTKYAEIFFLMQDTIERILYNIERIILKKYAFPRGFFALLFCACEHFETSIMIDWLNYLWLSSWRVAMKRFQTASVASPFKVVVVISRQCQGILRSVSGVFFRGSN